MYRRTILHVGLVVAGIFGLGHVFWHGAYATPAQSGPHPCGELHGPDANGLYLPPGFMSRRIAQAHAPVPLAKGGMSKYLWHRATDGGAVFPRDDGMEPIGGGGGSSRGLGTLTVQGDWLSSTIGNRAEVKVRVLGSAGARLILTRGGLPLLSTTVEAADATYTTESDISRQGAVRAELWPNAISAPLGLHPIALSNPVFFGPEPPLPLRAPLPEAFRAHAIATLSTTPRNP